MTRQDGRRFGVTVGSAFLVLAVAAWWRDHRVLAAVLAVLGAVLGLAGIVVPTRLGGVERGWMALAHAISSVTTPVVMAAMYLGVFLPVGVIRRALGGNPLVHAERGGSFWRERPEGARRSRSMRRQF